MPSRLTARDVLPAVFLAAAAATEATLNGAVSDGTLLPPAWAAAMAMTIATRRVLPLASLVACWLVFDAQELLSGTLSEGALPFVVLLVAMHGAAARLTGRHLKLAIASSYVGAAISVAVDTGGPDLDSGLYAALVVTAALGSGLLFGGRQRAIESLAAEHEQVLRERAQVERQAAERERTRIAYELHDIITHRVSAMVLQATSERRAIERRDVLPRDVASRTTEVLRSIEELGRDAMVELRHLLGALHHDDAAPRLPQPGADRIASLVDETARSGHPVTLETVGAERPVPAGIGLSAYRVVQESLSNAIRHAPGARTDVSLRYEDDRIEVRIENDAPPATARTAETGLGMGLAGMRERVALFGGTIDAGPTDAGNGFRVVARLPFPEEQA